MDHAYNPLVKEPLHVGAGKLALLSIFAAEHSKFWEMNDILFNLGKDIKLINMKSLAEQCDLSGKDLPGILKKPSILLKLVKDIREGMTLGIGATPGYLIEGKVYIGQIPPDILKPYL
jgi:protein-disulfide isomerase